MKAKIRAMAAAVLAACLMLTGCASGTKPSPEAPQNKPASETDKKDTRPEGSGETPASEPLVLETPAGAVLVGKIQKDAEGWYFAPEQPVTVKLTCYIDRPLSYENIAKIRMFADSEDGANKELYRNDTVTVTGMLQDYRDTEVLYLYPCRIERGKTVKTGYAVPELTYPAEESAAYDPAAPLPEEMQPTVKNGVYAYNPYILTTNTLERMGNAFADFYKGFVDAWLAYETSCPCADKSYAENFTSVLFYEFPLFSADGAFDLQTGYDESTQTLTWRYTSKNKAEHDKLIADFTAAANGFLGSVRATDSPQLRARSVYHAFCTAMTYDYEIMTSRERIDAYYAYMLHRGICVTFACAMSQLYAQVGVQATVVSGDTENGEGHVWNLVTIGGENYFCDSTYELSVQSGGAYAYFGMTMEDRLNDGSGYSEESMVAGALHIMPIGEVVLSPTRLSLS